MTVLTARDVDNTQQKACLLPTVTARASRKKLVELLPVHACIDRYLRLHCGRTYISVTAASCLRHTLQVSGRAVLTGHVRVWVRSPRHQSGCMRADRILLVSHPSPSAPTQPEAVMLSGLTAVSHATGNPGPMSVPAWPSAHASWDCRHTQTAGGARHHSAGAPGLTASPESSELPRHTGRFTSSWQLPW